MECRGGWVKKGSCYCIAGAVFQVLRFDVDLMTYMFASDLFSTPLSTRNSGR